MLVGWDLLLLDMLVTSTSWIGRFKSFGPKHQIYRECLTSSKHLPASKTKTIPFALTHTDSCTCLRFQDPAAALHRLHNLQQLSHGPSRGDPQKTSAESGAVLRAGLDHAGAARPFFHSGCHHEEKRIARRKFTSQSMKKRHCNVPFNWSAHYLRNHSLAMRSRQTQRYLPPPPPPRAAAAAGRASRRAHQRPARADARRRGRDGPGARRSRSPRSVHGMVRPWHAFKNKAARRCHGSESSGGGGVGGSAGLLGAGTRWRSRWRSRRRSRWWS